MIRHVYLLKLKDKSKIPEISAKLLTLKEKIPYMLAMEVGTDFKGDSNSWDMAEVCTFATMEDFKRFGADPYHAQIREYIGSLREDGVKIDFEV